MPFANKDYKPGYPGGPMLSLFCDNCGETYAVHKGIHCRNELPPSALDVQEGGDHYKTLPIQPVEFIHRNGIGFIAGNVIKYVTRYKLKNGVEDLKKARHYIDLLIELEGAK